MVAAQAGNGAVDDAVQDTLMAIHAKRHTWLAAVARHKWIDRLRAMRTTATERLSDEVAVGDHGDAVSSTWSLDRLLQTLSPAQSDAIRLVKLQGHSIEEVAARTGCKGTASRKWPPAPGSRRR